MNLLRAAPLCSLILFSVGCNASETNALTPTSPSAVADSSPSGLDDPSPNKDAPTPPRGNLTIRGIVTERLVGGGVRPMPGVNVNAWVDAGIMGYSYMWANGGRRSDGTGRYELTGLPGSAIVIVDAWTDGHDYVQQCAAPPTRMDADTTVDLQLVSRENVSSTPDGIPMAPGFRFVSGVIFENTPAGKRPVRGVHVDYEPVMDSPAAHTFSDANGRYLLCGIPVDNPADIGAGFNGRAAYATARPGQTIGVDLVFP
jgi:hypothetical protein